MAWWAEIGGVDQTTNIDLATEPVHVSKLFNERSVATFVCMPGFTPPRRTEVVFYAKDGVSRIYGGLISYTKRWASGPLASHQRVECVDFKAYADWAYTDMDFGYASPVTLLQILQDLAPYLAEYGVTLSPTQPTGPTFAPFSWPGMRLSDCFRALTDATGGQYAYQIDATKVLSMTAAGAVSAPWSITDADPHCTDLRVVNRDQNYASKVLLVCGPTGVGTEAFTHAWTAQAGVYAYALEGLNVPCSVDGPNVVDIDGVIYPIFAPGIFPNADYIEWDQTLDDGTLTFRGTTQGLIAGGETLTITYYPQYPFVVTADAGATPTVARKFTRTDLVTYDAAQDVADGLLDQLNQEPEELEIDTDEDGLEPGQALVVSITAPLAVSMTALVTSLDITLQDDETWLYVAAATEGAVYQQAIQPLVYFRSLSGGSGGSVAVSGAGGGSVTVLTSPFPLGGARTASVPMAASPAYTPVLNWIPFVADATFSARVRVALAARSAGVGVTARLVESADSSFSTVSVVGTSSTITSQTLTETVFSVVITTGKWYRLELISDTASESAYGIGQLESTA